MRRVLLLGLLGAAIGCDPAAPGGPAPDAPDARSAADAPRSGRPADGVDVAASEALPDDLYASELHAFEPGSGAGFGREALPGIVLGPPEGRGRHAGSTDAVALGDGGTIVVGFGDRRIEDGPGPDFIVFENPFVARGSGGSERDPGDVWAEPGEVSVRGPDGRWHAFPCAPDEPGHPDCAGVRPVQPYDAEAVRPLDPAVTGGDAFDLADVGVEATSRIRIRDRSERGFSPSKGFDLDAVGGIHIRAAE